MRPFLLTQRGVRKMGDTEERIVEQWDVEIDGVLCHIVVVEELE